MTSSLPDLRPRIGEIARRVLGEPNKRLSTKSQQRFGTNGSIAVEISGAKRGQWFDHEAGVGGGPWELLTVKGGLTNGAAAKWLQARLGIEIEPRRSSPSTITATSAAVSCPRSADSSQRPSDSDGRTVKATGLGA